MEKQLHSWLIVRIPSCIVPLESSHSPTPTQSHAEEFIGRNAIILVGVDVFG